MRLCVSRLPLHQVRQEKINVSTREGDRKTRAIDALLNQRVLLSIEYVDGRIRYRIGNGWHGAG